MAARLICRMDVSALWMRSFYETDTIEGNVYFESRILPRLPKV
jgi:hypothetical protein